MEKNEFQNRVFLFSNFPGAAILNNCDMSWLLYCSDTKSFCLITKGQPFHVKRKKKIKTNVIANIMSCDLK